MNRGFAPVLMILGIVVVAMIGGGVYYLKNNSVLPNEIKLSEGLTSNNTDSSSSAVKLNSAKISPSPTSISSVKSPTPFPKATSFPTLTPTPAIRSVSVSGFAYEDRNDDGIFNSDDVRLPNMDLNYSDSKNPDPAYTYFTIDSGNFSVSLNVKGNLIVNPLTYNNFRPRNGALTFSSNATNVSIPFRSASAPVANQSGVIEGDIFNDTNKNNNRDSGENGIYFMKLYLQDGSGNYYNTEENAQATDPGGHFKYVNLPIGKTFTITLSNPTGSYTINKSTYNFTLTNTTPTISNINIPVVQN